MSDSYTENVAPEEVISFTVDEQDNVLALIKVTDTGDLFNWEGEDWIEVDVDDDNPNIFDQTVIDVEREDIGAALELWKESVANGSPLTKEDILTLAALEQ
jgi:ABC-type lipoprotein release transport system permease subunit